MLTMTLEDQGAVLEDGRLELKGRNLEIYFLKMQNHLILLNIHYIFGYF